MAAAGTPALRPGCQRHTHVCRSATRPIKAILDPDALNVGGQSTGFAPGGGVSHRIGAGSGPSRDIGVARSAARAGAPRLGLAEFAGPSHVPELGADADEDNSRFFKHEGTAGLDTVPSPISGHSGAFGAMSGGGGGGGGGGLPGGFSSGVNSDFPGGAADRSSADNGSRSVAVNAPGARASSGRSRGSTSVILTYDPNAPFGASDLTKLGSDDVNANGLNGNSQTAAAPLATPEPGTLLLVGSAAVFDRARFVETRQIHINSRLEYGSLNSSRSGLRINT